MAITDLIGGSITEGVAKIISLFKVDPNLAAQNAQELAKIQASMQSKILDASIAEINAQSQANANEATNPKIFVSGWRPFIGWVCGSGLAFQFVIGPVSTWIAHLAGKAVQFPQLDMGTLLTLLLGMLGLGGMRTYEKISGIEDTHPLK